jgi:hypothetical protein
MKRYTVCGSTSRRWKQNWSWTSIKSACRNGKIGRTRKWSSRRR